jgi:hypothetical protein
MPDLDLAEIARRPQRYWNADGIPELIMGMLWMLWGASWLAGERIPRGGAYNAFWLLVPALLAGTGVVAVWATRALKARVTFPRAGYVVWREPSRLQRFAAGLIAIVTAAIVAAVAARARSETGTTQLAAPILSVILSLGFLVAALRQHAPHYLALAAVAVALGILLWKSNAGWESVNWLFVLIGAASAALGCIRLALFLRTHPRRAEAA